jgi:putative hydrolase of the HAD superfamily
MKKQYRHIFFDLDHTLWDFERNAEEAKQELFISLNLQGLGILSYQEFREKYKAINLSLWDLYREDKIGKAELNFNRFYLTLLEFGIDDPALTQLMADRFLILISLKTYLFPYAKEILEYLYKRYPLYIITNGFEEVQFPKLTNSGLDVYFTSIITSEEAGVKKPDLGIFNFALQKVNALPSESIMIGDDLEVDVRGASQAGIDQVYVNHLGLQHNEAPTFEVSNLREIENFL